MDLEWKFTQSFGEKDNLADITDGDTLTAVEFDASGDKLAVGDKAGRIWLFEGHKSSQIEDYIPRASSASTGSLRTSYNITTTSSSKKFDPLEYSFHYQFQSHEPDFDCLKSLEIEEKINMIKFCPHHNQNTFLLSSNDKTVKLWKVVDKTIKKVSAMNVIYDDANSGIIAKPHAFNDIYFPRLVRDELITLSYNKNSYQNAHAYHINSISANSDGETFISADDLRLNLWNLNISDTCFSMPLLFSLHYVDIVDIKPENMDELTEVITCSIFHPTHCNILTYSSSRGSIRLVDLRTSALCDQYVKLYELEEDPTTKSFFSEIVSSISDIKFSPDGQYIISRDYLTMKMWDVRMEKYPVLNIPIHDYLRPKLSDLYESDCIFDKFECAMSPDGEKFLSGSYSDHFLIYDNANKTHTTIEASNPVSKAKPVVQPKPASSNKETVFVPPASIPQTLDINNLVYDKKIMHLAWHPTSNVIAVAGLNNLYIYQA